MKVETAPPVVYFVHFNAGVEVPVMSWKEIS